MPTADEARTAHERTEAIIDDPRNWPWLQGVAAAGRLTVKLTWLGYA